MGSFKYTGNLNPDDKTGAITFRDDRPDLVLGGEPGELNEEEHAALSVRHALEPAGAASDSESQKKPGKGQQPQTAEERS